MPDMRMMPSHLLSAAVDVIYDATLVRGVQWQSEVIPSKADLLTNARPTVHGFAFGEQPPNKLHRDHAIPIVPRRFWDRLHDDAVSTRARQRVVSNEGIEVMREPDPAC